jgi:hypothetical protein
MRTGRALVAALAWGWASWTLAPGLAQAGAPTQDGLEAKRDKKLQSEFLKAAPWMTDFAKAREESKKTSKPIFGYFTRSYAP